MEDVMLDIMFDIPSQEGIAACVIDAETIKKVAQPRLIPVETIKPPKARKALAKAE